MKNVNSYDTVMKENVGIRLNGNENFNNISEKVINEIKKEIKLYSFNRYPDSECVKLRESYGKIIGLDKENIIAGNGSDEMISLAVNAYVNKGKKVLTLSPDFSMYDFYVTCNEGKLIKFKTEECGDFDFRKFLEYADKIDPNLIIFSNPNNPTGNLIKIEDIETLVKAFPNTPIVIDEAYYEFGGVTVLPLINKYNNLIITRTLSKAWGLAAIRVGFLISNTQIIQELNKFKVPYNLNQVSQNIACKVLEAPEQILKSVEKIVFERERLYANLKGVEEKNPEIFKVYPSKANFIYGKSSKINCIKDALEARGIIIRYFDNNFFRVSVGAPWENDIVVNMIVNILEYEEDKHEEGAS